MVTLATLEKASAQEVFSQIVNHLRKQGEKCLLDAGGCAYKNTRGQACAAGCLIAESEYNKEFEGLSWAGVAGTQGVPQKHYDLIREMQIIHDTKPTQTWEDGFKLVAQKYHLELP